MFLFSLTAGFLIHGRHARIFGPILDQMFDQGFGQVVWTREYNVQYYWDGEIQCTGLQGREHTVLQYYRDGEKRGTKPCN